MSFTSQQLRKKYLYFFAQHKHSQVTSSSTIPDSDDQTVLFTTAGMQQFVPNLMGKKHEQGDRLMSVQKCVRTVDIDEVGDNRHLTFFEMLGNWSLGDYFKKESIEWSYKFLIEELKIDKNKLWVTVYGGDEKLEYDQESHDVWLKMGIPEYKIVGIGAPTDAEKRRKKGRGDNFWAAGKTGPCGPSTELFIWLGEGDPKEGQTPETDEYNFIEVWNNVFMEYEQKEDSSLVPLAKKNVDTGMGLERLTMIIQEKTTIFETDIYDGIIAEIEKLSGKKYPPKRSPSGAEGGDLNEKNPITMAFRVIADHIRCSSHLIADGVAASNEGRGYVLRRLLRRAIRFGKSLGITNFLEKIATVYIDEFSEFYPELGERKTVITDSLKIEEENFIRTLEKGEKRLEELISKNNKIQIKEISIENFTPFALEFLWKNEGGYTLEYAIKYTQENFIILYGAFINNELVGVSAGQKTDDFIELRAVVVSPQFRKQGVASLLIDGVNNWAIKNNFKKSIVWGKNTVLGFYNNLEGYKNTGKEIDKMESGKMTHTLFEMNLEKNKECSISYIFSGKEAFILSDTYGFPQDLTREILEEKGFEIDEEKFNAEFEKELKAQKERSRSAGKFEMKGEGNEVFDDLPATKFIGDTGENLQNIECTVLAFVIDEDKSFKIVLDKTPFYAEGGGQVGDRGELIMKNQKFKIIDTKKLKSGVFVHYGMAGNNDRCSVLVGENIKISVDQNLRNRITRHHSAAHLLQSALISVLGDGIEQAGSLVDEKRTRFDFSFPRALKTKEIVAVQNKISEYVDGSFPIEIKEMSIVEAKEKGAMALFSEKYGDTVRTVKMGTSAPLGNHEITDIERSRDVSGESISFELCGGTHIQNTSEIGAVQIISETSSASGIRRIEMVVGQAAQELLDTTYLHEERIAAKLKCPPVQIIDRISKLMEEKKVMNDALGQIEKKLLSFEAEEFYERKIEVKGNDGKIKTIICEPIPTHDMKRVGGMARALSSKNIDLVVLFTEDGGIAIATQKGGIDAREVFAKIKEIAGGNGGGSPFFVQGKGVELEEFGKVRECVENCVEK